MLSAKSPIAWNKKGIPRKVFIVLVAVTLIYILASTNYFVKNYGNILFQSTKQPQQPSINNINNSNNNKNDTSQLLSRRINKSPFLAKIQECIDDDVIISDSPVDKDFDCDSNFSDGANFDFNVISRLLSKVKPIGHGFIKQVDKVSACGNDLALAVRLCSVKKKCHREKSSRLAEFDDAYAWLEKVKGFPRHFPELIATCHSRDKVYGNQNAYITKFEDCEDFMGFFHTPNLFEHYEFVQDRLINDKNDSKNNKKDKNKDKNKDEKKVVYINDITDVTNNENNTLDINITKNHFINEDKNEDGKRVVDINNITDVADDEINTSDKSITINNNKSSITYENNDNVIINDNTTTNNNSSSDKNNNLDELETKIKNQQQQQQQQQEQEPSHGQRQRREHFNYDKLSSNSPQSRYEHDLNFGIRLAIIIDYAHAIAELHNELYYTEEEENSMSSHALSAAIAHDHRLANGRLHKPNFGNHTYVFCDNKPLNFVISKELQVKMLDLDAIECLDCPDSAPTQCAKDNIYLYENLKIPIGPDGNAYVTDKNYDMMFFKKYLSKIFLNLKFVEVPYEFKKIQKLMLKKLKKTNYQSPTAIECWEVMKEYQEKNNYQVRRKKVT